MIKYIVNDIDAGIYGGFDSILNAEDFAKKLVKDGSNPENVYISAVVARVQNDVKIVMASEVIVDGE